MGGPVGLEFLDDDQAGRGLVGPDLVRRVGVVGFLENRGGGAGGVEGEKVVGDLGRECLS